jgi:cytosine/adenosine deaminase-related metal-dependent hydrolase
MDRGVLLLRNARPWGHEGLRDIAFARRVVEGVQTGRGEAIDLEGRLLLPGLVNGHDHLGFSTFPPLGRPPYASVYEWTEAVDGGEGNPEVRAALAVPLADRLFLGGVRNLLCGVTSVAHHDAYHRSLGKPDFPIQVLADYTFAHSPGLTPRLRSTYRWGGPWMVHAAEGVDDRCAREIDALAEAGVLRPNTVVVHGVALRAEDGPRIARARAAVVWCPESNRCLYGATAPIETLRAAQVRIGLGSDSSVSGVRDPLSNLSAARREGSFTDAELVQLATSDTAGVLGLPVGGFTPSSPADFVVVDDLERFLSGERTSVALVVVRGRAVYGFRSLLQGVNGRWASMRLDGAERLVAGEIGRRVATIWRRHPTIRGAPWMSGIEFE